MDGCKTAMDERNNGLLLEIHEDQDQSTIRTPHSFSLSISSCTTTLTFLALDYDIRMEEVQNSIKISLSKHGMDGDRSPSTRAASPLSSSFRGTLTKQMSQKGVCLCSPTTHAGSFRCRYHRDTSSFRRSSISIGSGLSDFGNKPVESPLTNLGNKTGPAGSSVGV